MWEVIGHRWAIALIESTVKAGNVAGAYLITGPEGVGKRTLALEFARALMCGNVPPCGECRECRAVRERTHPDVMVFEPQGGRIKIEQMRELRRTAALAPHRSGFKVYVVTDMETATPEAANSLLKTLEEPPEHLVLILTANSADALLPTIVSRCRVINLRPVPTSEIEEALHWRWNLPLDEAALLARISAGCPGRAVRMARDPQSRKERAEDFETMFRLLRSDLVERFEWAGSASKDGARVRGMLERWLTAWRDMLLLAEDRAEDTMNPDLAEEIAPIAHKLGRDGILQGMQALRQTVQALDKNANLRLALEVLMLNLPRL